MVIKISPKFSEYIEKLQYEVSAYQDLLVFSMRQNLDKEIYDKYNQDYKDIFVEFSLAKNRLEKEIIQKQYPELKNYTWNLNYLTYECEVTPL